MRGDGVGVGDIGEVFSVAWCSRDIATSRDFGGAGREHDRGLVCGC